MGAKTAMVLALRHPELVKYLIAVDNSPADVAITSEFPRYMRRMKDIEAAQLTKQSEADQMLQTEEENVSIRHFLLTNLVRDPETKILKWRIPLNILAKSLDYMGDFPILPDQARYKKPTLFIRGTLSRYVPDEMIPLIGRFFPRFQIKDIEAGHWVQAENPEEFRAVLTRFIVDEEEKASEQAEAPQAANASHYGRRPSETQIRSFSTSARAMSSSAEYSHVPTTLSDHQYFKLADASLNLILLQLEAEADENADVDVEYSDGVMNVALPNGTYVINRQPPSKQIWLSSPTSGPKRFDFVEGTGWVYKDGTELKALLESEWRSEGVKIDLEGLGLRDDVQI